MGYLDKYKVTVPEGVSGDWAIERFTVTKEDVSLQQVRAMFNGGRYVPEGDYTKLIRNGSIIMSDTPDEIRDHLSFIHKAQGHVLINGLGLGVVLQGVLEKPEVDKATVIELSPDVIKLVGLYYQNRYGSRLEIIQANALTWKPPKGIYYSTVWHDIWDNICSDNLSEMHKLHRRYGRRCDWQGSWARAECEQQKRQWQYF